MFIWDVLKANVLELSEERWSVLEGVVLNEISTNQQFKKQLETKVQEAFRKPGGGYGGKGD